MAGSSKIYIDHFESWFIREVVRTVPRGILAGCAGKFLAGRTVVYIAIIPQTASFLGCAAAGTIPCTLINLAAEIDWLLFMDKGQSREDQSRGFFRECMVLLATPSITIWWISPIVQINPVGCTVLTIVGFFGGDFFIKILIPALKHAKLNRIASYLGNA